MSSPDQTPPAANRGGALTHKNPDCPCSACTARRRREEALVGGAGDTSSEAGSAEVLEADVAISTTVRRNPRYHIAAWLQLKATDPEITITEAARRLQLHRSTLQAYIGRAVREGWLKFDDPLQRVEYELIPKVIKNLNQFLDEGDKTVTIETAKGTLFPSYKEARGIQEAPTTVLALRIEAPAGGEEMKIISGHIVGKPKQLDLEEQV